MLRKQHGETKRLHEKHVHQNRKKAWSVPCIGIENNITYQNAKTHARKKKKKNSITKNKYFERF